MAVFLFSSALYENNEIVKLLFSFVSVLFVIGSK